MVGDNELCCCGLRGIALVSEDIVMSITRNKIRSKYVLMPLTSSKREQ